MALSVGRRQIESQIRIPNGTVDVARETDTEQVCQPEVVPLAARLIEQGRRKRGEHAAAALHELANRGTLGVRQRGGVREDQQLEGRQVARRQHRLVCELERHTAFDQRVIHPEHVVCGAIAIGHSAVIGGGLFGVEQRHPCERRLVAQIALVSEVPVVEPLDRRQPAPVVEDAGELRDPRAHAVGRAFGNPEPDLRLALHRVLPSVRLFDPDAENAADGPPPHHRSQLLGAAAVVPRRRQAAAGLVVRELNRGQLTRGLQIGRPVRNESSAGIRGSHGGVPPLP
jgi:hypothetical protein